MRWLTVAATLPVLALAGCGSEAAAPEPPASPAVFVIIDADRHGVIVADGGHHEYRGVRRDGTVVWRSPQAASAPDAVSCLARCPDALLSGNPAARDSATTPDPEPVLVVDGRRTPIGAAALRGQAKRQVLSAVGGDDFLVATGDGLDAYRPGAAPARFAVNGFRTSWQQTRDGRYGLAVTGGDDPDRADARWFTRDATGWRPAGAPVPVTGSSACLSADGGRAMVLGGRPAVLDRTGRSTPVGGFDFASDCALAATGGIVGSYGQTNAGMTAQLLAFDRDGRAVWRASVAGTARVTADPTAARVAYAAKGTATEIDLTTGRTVRTIGNAYAAAYDDTGTLVVADAQGSPRWL
jgi:hypothetical protein